jgi:hypothetical protein
MSTINGFGSQFYGWKRLDDGTAEATTWIVAAFFPIIPLRRSRLEILTQPGVGVRYRLFGGGSFRLETREIDRLPLDWSINLKTYFKGFVIVPVLLMLPLILVIGGLALYQHLYGPRQPPNKPPVVFLVGMFAVLVYWAILLAKTLDRSSGRHLFAAMPAVPADKPPADSPWAA